MRNQLQSTDCHGVPTSVRVPKIANALKDVQAYLTDRRARGSGFPNIAHKLAVPGIASALQPLAPWNTRRSRADL